MRDQNGNQVYKGVRRNPSDGLWYTNVFWGGGASGAFVSRMRRYGYRTRAEARDGDISDFNAASYHEPPAHMDLDTIDLDHDMGTKDLTSPWEIGG